MSILYASIVQRSYARCSRDKGFFDSFYDHFLASSEEIRNHFKDTSRAKQKIFIHNGIATVLLYAMGSQQSSDRLHELAEQHGPSEIDVDAGLYPLWADSLLHAVAEYDPEYTDEVGLAWRETIQKGIEVFIGKLV